MNVAKWSQVHDTTTKSRNAFGAATDIKSIPVTPPSCNQTAKDGFGINAAVVLDQKILGTP
jgi:hypothetical protein